MTEFKTINYFNKDEFLGNNLIFQLLQQFFKTGERFYNKQFEGLVENVEDFCAELEKIENIKKVFETISEDDRTIYYFFEHHFVSVYAPNSNKITVDLITDKKEFLEKIAQFLETKFQEVKKEKQIHMITPDEYTEQISLYPMGDVSSELNRENYDEETLKKVDYVVNELNSKNPTGRMLLIDGSPGTGKSFLIRGILKELNFGICVLVPVSMLESLDKPTLIPLLMRNKSARNVSDLPSARALNESKGKPIILILEDADNILVPRAADNMSAISSLLNYTDGIFGSLFDLRIIATTNAPHVEIEKALLRPGRLLKRIHVGLLSRTKAEAIFERLTGRKRKFEKEISLAAVYSLSKGNEIEEDIDDDHQQTVGF